jgi:hypothetical protein
LPKNVGNENKALKSVQQGDFEVSLEVHNFVITKNVYVVQLGYAPRYKALRIDASIVLYYRFFVLLAY